MKVTTHKFCEFNNETVEAYTLQNDNGMRITCINYGGIITELYAPDRNGVLENIVLGFDNMEDYLTHSPYFGAMVGRVAGRIKGGQFELDGKTFSLEKNENGNSLHSGATGFSNVIWDATVIQKEDAVGVEFRYVSQDGEGGFPGTLNMKVTYLLNNQNEFTINADGNTDQTTLVNITNHTYFNLSGDLKDDILNHELTLKSDRFIELNEELLPTGELIEVEGTPFDFQQGRKIQDGTVSSFEQNKLVGNGYDHPFLLTTNHDQEINLYEEKSGRTLTIETNQPGVVVYTSNQLQGDFAIQGVKARHYLGICLETQGIPDAIHHPHFPSVVLDKDQPYNWATKYSFGVK